MDRGDSDELRYKGVGAFGGYEARGNGSEKERATGFILAAMTVRGIGVVLRAAFVFMSVKAFRQR